MIRNPHWVRISRSQWAGKLTIGLIRLVTCFSVTILDIFPNNLLHKFNRSNQVEHFLDCSRPVVSKIRTLMRERSLEIFLSQFVWRGLFVDVYRRFSWFLPRVDSDKSAEDRSAAGNDDNGRLKSISKSKFYSNSSKKLRPLKYTFTSKMVHLFVTVAFQSGCWNWYQDFLRSWTKVQLCYSLTLRTCGETVLKIDWIGSRP